MFRYFENERDALLYKKFRPSTPDFLVREILDWMRPEVPLDVAVDLGCGSGQHTLSLAPHFRRVLAYDVSQAQIQQARRHPTPDHVTYNVAAAESLPVEADSVQLLTGSTSFHWFDFERFFAEVDRVLVPGGVVAAAGVHPIPTLVHEDKEEELNRKLVAFVRKHTTTLPERAVRYCRTQYVDLPLPYKEEEKRFQDLPFHFDGSLEVLMGSLTAYLLLMHKDDPDTMLATLDDFRKELLEMLGLAVDTPPEDVPLALRRTCYLAMCRKPCAAPAAPAP